MTPPSGRTWRHRSVWARTRSSSSPPRPAPPSSTSASPAPATWRADYATAASRRRTSPASTAAFPSPPSRAAEVGNKAYLLLWQAEDSAEMRSFERRLAGGVVAAGDAQPSVPLEPAGVGARLEGGAKVIMLKPSGRPPNKGGDNRTARLGELRLLQRGGHLRPPLAGRGRRLLPQMAAAVGGRSPPANSGSSETVTSSRLVVSSSTPASRGGAGRAGGGEGVITCER